mgnify:CR=1 FL=1
MIIINIWTRNFNPVVISKMDNATNNRLKKEPEKWQRWVFPNLIKKQSLLKNLFYDMSKFKTEKEKKSLYKILMTNNYEKKLKEYCKKIYFKIYGDKEWRDPKVKEWIMLFQIAYTEMEWLFKNIYREEWNWKTWFDHLLWVLDNILAWPNPTIEECIIAMLHDSIEDIPWYTVQHVKEVYGVEIANSVNNISKQPLEYYINTKDGGKIKLNKLEQKDDDGNRKELISEITRKTRREDYYGDIENRWVHETNVKFSDRLHSLQTMHYYDKNNNKNLNKDLLIKKLGETEKYFLIPEVKDNVSTFHYNRLKEKYLERKEKLDNWEI